MNLPNKKNINEIFDGDKKQFDAILKHYHDLFSYHANQRLTTFNFFIVSLSFLTSAYAILLSRGTDASPLYDIAASISFTTYLLIIAFSRLDARNEQIIQINEQPLKIIQDFISNKMGSDFWKSFIKSEVTVPLTTFGTILPIIYLLAAAVAWSGFVYAIIRADISFLSTCKCENTFTVLLWIAGAIISFLLINSLRPVGYVDVWSGEYDE